MKTLQIMFPLMLALTSGCASALDSSPVMHPGAEPAVSVGAACVVSGEVRTLAPKALVRTGIELVSVGHTLALGFGRTPHEAVAMKLDPATAMAIGSLSRFSEGPIRRITPLDTGTDLDAAIDSDCKADRLTGSTTIAAREPFVIGTTNGSIAWASCASETPKALWAFTQGSVEELRGIALADGGFAVVFRSDGTVWFGRLDSDKNPAGPLSVVAQRPGVRTPTIAASGESLLVVWTERSSEQDRWSLGGASVAPCGHAKPIQLAMPSDGVEGDAIQPALTSIGAGRFLLAWTQGPASSHEVRAMTLESDGRTLGAALRVSSGAEAGWARPALASDGRGAVVYLVPTPGGFAVAATPIACPVSPSAASSAVATMRL